MINNVAIIQEKCTEGGGLEACSQETFPSTMPYLLLENTLRNISIPTLFSSFFSGYLGDLRSFLHYYFRKFCKFHRNLASIEVFLGK